jgi:hypothetical protein
MGLILDAAPDLATGYQRGFTVLGTIVIAGGLCAAVWVNPSGDRERLVEHLAARPPLGAASDPAEPTGARA